MKLLPIYAVAFLSHSALAASTPNFGEPIGATAIKQNSDRAAVQFAQMRTSGPTYAPGGHALIPTVPQAPPTPTYNQPRQFSSPQFNTPTYQQPSYGGSGPTYAPGGHALIPTVQPPTFSQGFSPSQQSNAPSNQNIGTRLNLSPSSFPTSGINQNRPTTGGQVYQPTASRPPSFAGGFGSSAPNAFQPIGGQSTPSVGVVPPQTAGRLQLTPSSDQVSHQRSTTLSLSPGSVSQGFSQAYEAQVNPRGFVAGAVVDTALEKLKVIPPMQSEPDQYQRIAPVLHAIPGLEELARPIVEGQGADLPAGQRYPATR